ncbi:MAG: hypothetical protein AAF583_01695 [Pseudomonadota bacterium]
MTVSTQIRQVTLDGNGATTSWPFTFIVQAEDLVKVTRIASDSAETILANTEYTVTLSASGGSVTYPLTGDSLPAGESLRIETDLPYTQNTDFVSQGPFLAESHEDTFDRLLLLIQQVRDIANSRASDVLDPFVEQIEALGAIISEIQTVALNDLDISNTANSIGSVNSVAAKIADGTLDNINSGLGGQLTITTNVTTLADRTGQVGGDVVETLGRRTAGDGGGHKYVWDATDRSVDVARDELTVGQGDGGEWVAPASDRTGASGAWRAVLIGPINIMLYGANPALPDETSPAIQKLIDSQAVVRASISIFIPNVVLDPGQHWFLRQTIQIPQGRLLMVQGDGSRGTELFHEVANAPMFNYTRTAGQVGSIYEFRDIIFRNNRPLKETGTAAIRSFGFDENEEDNYLRARNCSFLGFEAGIVAKHTGQTVIEDPFFQGNGTSMFCERGCSFWKINGGISFDDRAIFVQDTTADAHTNGWDVKDFDAVTNAGIGFYFEGVQALSFSSCGSDLGSAGEAAAWFRNCQDIYWDGGFISSNAALTTTRDGFRFDNSHSWKVSGVTIVNCAAGIRILKDASGLSFAIKGVVSGCKFESNINNHVIMGPDVTGCKIVHNHFQTTVARTGSDFEVYGNFAGVDEHIVNENTFVGSSYVIAVGAASITNDNIFGAAA